MESDTTSFSLRGRPRAVVLEAEGFHHPDSARGGPLVFTRYDDVTHLASSPRALWIGTRRSVYIVARRSFVDPHGPEHLVRALLERVAGRPGGAAQLARMAEIEERARAASAPRATWGLVALCVALYGVELAVGPDVHGVGYFTRALAEDGDWWRVVTANLLHAGWLHLALNGMGLAAIGPLLERSIGSARMLVVMLVSGLGSMLASGLWNTLPVVGVSGVVCGILGALAWLELRSADRLPSWWRVPRRALYWMIGATAALGLLPFVAGAAHVGGFVAGIASAALLTGGERRRAPGAVRGLAGAGLAVCAAALATAGYEIARHDDYEAYQILRLGRLPGASPDELNNAAWTIAIDDGSSRAELEDALSLAQRAADQTGRRRPYILDTLAEVHFRLGQRAEAVATIEEAIRQAPFDGYYRQQRERFLGQRPPSPAPWEEPERDWGTPGLTV